MVREVENVGEWRLYPFEFGTFTDEAGRVRWRIRDNRLSRVCDCWTMQDAMLIAQLLNARAVAAADAMRAHLQDDRGLTDDA